MKYTHDGHSDVNTAFRFFLKATLWSCPARNDTTTLARPRPAQNGADAALVRHEAAPLILHALARYEMVPLILRVVVRHEAVPLLVHALAQHGTVPLLFPIFTRHKTAVAAGDKQLGSCAAGKRKYTALRAQWHSPTPRPPVRRIARRPTPQNPSRFDSRATHARTLLPAALASSQVKLILSPKQRAKPAASRTRTCTNAAVCIASGECPSRF